MATLSLDELCEQTGLTARTVRYYQASGLLQRPARAGRNAVYSDEHVQRVRQIAEMRARGLKLDAIRDVLHARAIGKAPVVALLGPELSSDQWLTQSSATLTAVEVAELLGERYLDMLADLEKAGYLRKVSTAAGTRWQADDLPLLRGALQLAEIGTDVALSAQARDLLREALRQVAEDLVRMWRSESGRLYEGEVSRHEIALHGDRVRAVAWQSAALVMAQEIERALEHVDELGPERDQPPFTPASP